MIEERLEAAGGGTITLDSTGRVQREIGDIRRSATSWVMVTPERIPTAALPALGRSGVARLAVASALLATIDSNSTGMELGLTGFSHYLTDAASQTEAGIVPGFPSGTGQTLSQCMLQITGTTYLSQVRKGTAIRALSSPATVDLDGEHHDALGFAQWLATTFKASWRVVLRSSGGEMWPHLDIAPLSDLWGTELLTAILVSPDVPAAPPKPGTWLGHPAAGPCRIINGAISRTSDGSGMVSDSWVHATNKREGLPANVGRAIRDLRISHPNGLGTLARHKRFESSNKLPHTAQLQSVAEQVLDAENLPVDRHEITITSPTSAVRLPLGAPVALMDLGAGIADPTIAANVGSTGAAPVLGSRVVARTLPFVAGMGCYLAHAGVGEGWRILDLTDSVVEEPTGNVEVAKTLFYPSLADALSGTVRI